MTRFRRNGHHRTSKNGIRHWVSETTVDRDDWSRSSFNYSAPSRTAPPSPQRDPFLDKYAEFIKNRRVAACFINPNATCPVCGESVFYYQNENGSRVFFDELGPPWPKHPCTDNRLDSTPFSGTQLGLTFSVRSQPAVKEIMQWQKDCDIDFESEFRKKYNNSPWQLATITLRVKSEKFVFIVVKLLNQHGRKKVYLSCESLPKYCKKGLLIAVGKRKISFIDTITLDPVEVLVKKYRGAAAFMDALDENDK